MECGFDDFEMDSNEIDNLKIDEKDKINILVVHGSLDQAGHKYHDIKTRSLQQFDYVALGHIHKAKIDGSNMIYPGSLISLGFDEQGEHGLVIGTIDKNKCNIEFKNMDYRQFEILEVDISDCNIVNEVIDKIELKDNIYRIVLTGVRNVDVNEVTEVLNKSGKHISEVIDETHTDYDLEEIARQKNLKGIFVNNMLELLANNPEKEKDVNKAIETVLKNMK